MKMGLTCFALREPDTTRKSCVVGPTLCIKDGLCLSVLAQFHRHIQHRGQRSKSSSKLYIFSVTTLKVLYSSHEDV